LKLKYPVIHNASFGLFSDDVTFIFLSKLCTYFLLS
jgi:hypothetical protein